MITLKQIQKHSLKISLGILALIAILIAWLALRPKPIQIIETSPANKETAVPLDSSIKITLNKSLPTKETPIFEIQPPQIGKISISPDRTQALFTPQGFYQPDTDYTINITSKSIKNYTFTFHTRPKISIRTQKTIQTVQKQTPYYKFLQTLPYYGNNFQIQYIKLDNSFYISIWREPIKPTKQKALQYIESFGIKNPAKTLKIRYNIPKTVPQ